jgi:hypothetical protein
MLSQASALIAGVDHDGHHPGPPDQRDAEQHEAEDDDAEDGGLGQFRIWTQSYDF